MAVDRLTEKEVNSLVPIYTPGLPKNMKGPGQPARAKASVTNPKNVCAAGYQGQGSREHGPLNPEFIPLTIR